MLTKIYETSILGNEQVTLASSIHVEHMNLVPSRAEECIDHLLLLPHWQFAALERVARSEQRTIGRVIRRLIGLHLAGGCARGDPDRGWVSSESIRRKKVPALSNFRCSFPQPNWRNLRSARPGAMQRRESSSDI